MELVIVNSPNLYRMSWNVYCWIEWSIYTFKVIPKFPKCTLLHHHMKGRSCTSRALKEAHLTWIIGGARHAHYMHDAVSKEPIAVLLSIKSSRHLHYWIGWWWRKLNERDNDTCARQWLNYWHRVTTEFNGCMMRKVTTSGDLTRRITRQSRAKIPKQKQNHSWKYEQ